MRLNEKCFGFGGGMQGLLFKQCPIRQRTFHLKVFPEDIHLLLQFCSLDGHFSKPNIFEKLVAKLSQYLWLCPSVQNYISRPAKSVSKANRFNFHFVKRLNDTAKVGIVVRMQGEYHY